MFNAGTSTGINCDRAPCRGFRSPLPPSPLIAADLQRPPRYFLRPLGRGEILYQFCCSQPDGTTFIWTAFEGIRCSVLVKPVVDDYRSGQLVNHLSIKKCNVRLGTEDRFKRYDCFLTIVVSLPRHSTNFFPIEIDNWLDRSMNFSL